MPTSSHAAFKRSTVNRLLDEAAAFFAEMGFALPPFAAWTPDDWRAAGPECAGIVRGALGWDVTDFGGGDFARTGLLLFTLRNGDPDAEPATDAKDYCEKVMRVLHGQVTPAHFHHKKMEDIIVRGAAGGMSGRLCVQLWHATPGDGLDEAAPVTVSCDGRERTVEAGGIVSLAPGESVTLPPRLYHAFWADPTSGGPLLVGEVSRTNDDARDNRFLDAGARLPEIEGDVPPTRLLASDYRRYYGFAG